MEQFIVTMHNMREGGFVFLFYDLLSLPEHIVKIESKNIKQDKQKNGKGIKIIINNKCFLGYLSMLRILRRQDVR